MSQALYAAMGGISAAQTQLEVISNNIANLNTTGFKASSVNFSDVFSTTISSGSVSTVSSGGTNPIQVGVGVQVSSVTKNFNSGSWVATGKNTDLMIQGKGFFTVQASDGQVYYTRAGDFSFDNSGNLVTAAGYKVLGTDSILAAKSSASTVYVPQSIIANVKGNTNLNNKLLNSLNNCGITKGAFNISVNNETPLSINVNYTDTSTVQDLVNSIQGQINAKATALQPLSTAAAALASANSTAYAAGAGLTAAQITAISTAADGAITAATNSFTAGDITAAQRDSILTAANAAKTTAGTLTAGVKMTDPQRDSIAGNAANVSKLYDDYAGVTVTLGTDAAGNPGTINFNVDGTHAKALTFSNPATGASNFIVETGLNNAVIKNNSYGSNVLDYTVDVTQVTSASAASSVTNYSINSDGSIQATYSNGDTLAVQLGKDGSTYEFVYTTSDGVEISSTNCNVDPNVANPANFVVQLASVTNTDGLISVGNNMYESGPNTGDILYSVGGDMGIGKIESGGLESSNVDLSSEFSNMIVAQRAVQANSRVFTTTSNIMDTIVSMGR